MIPKFLGRCLSIQSAQEPPSVSDAGSSTAICPMTPVEFERALTKWVKNGKHSDYFDAKRKILSCYDAMRNDPNSADATTLDLSEARGLTSLPDCVGQLTSLKILDLSTCAHLKSLPNTLGNLKSLTKLNLRSCYELTQLPDCVGQLNALTQLDMVNCKKITELPNSIGGLHSLEMLELSFCKKLTKLPDTLVNLTKLTILDADYCDELSTLPDDLTSLKSLTTLSLSGLNQLQDLPESLGKLEALTKLDLVGCNLLTRLPNSLGELRCLETLQLDHCQRLTCLPDNLGELQALRSLTLSGCNALSSMPRSVAELSRNCYISLGNTNLPTAVIERINQACLEQRALNLEQGPVISHNMGPGIEIAELPLDQQIKSWRDEYRLADPSNPPTWPSADVALTTLSPEEQNNLSNLLGRLRSTAHYRIAAANMVGRVCTLLNQLIEDPPAMKAAAALAIEASATCDDRIALGLMLLEEALIERRAMAAATSKPSLTELVSTAMGLFKSKQLQEIANKKAQSTAGFVDETEIVLKYITKLSKPLALPCPLDDMIFHGCAQSVSDQDIAKAKKEVLNLVKHGNTFNKYLAGWAPWQAAIKQIAPQLYQTVEQQIERIDDDIYARLETCDQYLDAERQNPAPDPQRIVELQAEQGQLMVKRQQTISDVWLNATQQLRN